MIREATQQDTRAIAAIYNYYVLNSTVTFEESPVTSEKIGERIALSQSHGLPWLVEDNGNDILGYAYATPWKARSAYRFSVESTVYVSNEAHGQGHGTVLYRELLSRLEDNGVRTVVGGVTLPNPASVGLHEKLGMKKVAHFENIGFKCGRWLDVGYWQLQLGESHAD